MVKANVLTDKGQISAFRRAMGPLVLDTLNEPKVVEVMANPDGSLWVDRVGKGMTQIGSMKSDDADAIIRFVAHHMGQTADGNHPTVSGTLPGTGERFEGTLPPIVIGACFSIRKPPGFIYKIEQYIEQGFMTHTQARIVREAVREKSNLFVSGGTGTGKTTFLNTILAEPGFVCDRVLILEDTQELRSSSPNAVRMFTISGNPEATLAQLVKKSLRMRPDRIVVGEVRGGEALDMLNAMNTGHEGSLTTLHANSAEDALHRLEDMIGMVSVNIPYRSIASAVDLVIHLERSEIGRRIGSMCRVKDYCNGKYEIEKL